MTLDRWYKLMAVATCPGCSQGAKCVELPCDQEDARDEIYAEYLRLRRVYEAAKSVKERAWENYYDGTLEAKLGIAIEEYEKE